MLCVMVVTTRKFKGVTDISLDPTTGLIKIILTEEEHWPSPSEMTQFVSDGGGGNTKFFCTLCDNLPMNPPWPVIAAIRCLNPVDPYRYIYFMSCFTHSLKVL